MSSSLICNSSSFCIKSNKNEQEDGNEEYEKEYSIFDGASYEE